MHRQDRILQRLPIHQPLIESINTDLGSDVSYRGYGSELQGALHAIVRMAPFARKCRPSDLQTHMDQCFREYFFCRRSCSLQDLWWSSILEMAVLPHPTRLEYSFRESCVPKKDFFIVDADMERLKELSVIRRSQCVTLGSVMEEWGRNGSHYFCDAGQRGILCLQLPIPFLHAVKQHASFTVPVGSYTKKNIESCCDRDCF